MLRNYNWNIYYYYCTARSFDYRLIFFSNERKPPPGVSETGGIMSREKVRVAEGRKIAFKNCTRLELDTESCAVPAVKTIARCKVYVQRQSYLRVVRIVSARRHVRAYVYRVSIRRQYALLLFCFFYPLLLFFIFFLLVVPPCDEHTLGVGRAFRVISTRTHACTGCITTRHV